MVLISQAQMIIEPQTRHHWVSWFLFDRRRIILFNADGLQSKEAVTRLRVQDVAWGI